MVDTEIVQSIVHALAALTPVILAGEVMAGIKLRQYKVIRKNNVENCKVYSPPSITKSEYIDRNKEYGNELINSIVKNFINTMSENLSPDNLHLLKRNLNSLQISETDFFMRNITKCIFGGYIGGYYVPIANRITVLSQKGIRFISGKKSEEQLHNHNFNHELMHMCSSVRQGLKPFCGFSQGNMGSGINEGYTEFLTERYFGKPENINAYRYETEVAELTETIVGKDKMESCFFNANLQGLIEELSKYSNPRDVQQFILDADISINLSHTVFNDTERALVEKSTNRICSFLTNTYMNQQDYSLLNDKITREQYRSNLLDYTKKISDFYELNQSGYPKKKKYEQFSNQPLLDNLNSGPELSQGNVPFSNQPSIENLNSGSTLSQNSPKVRKLVPPKNTPGFVNTIFLIVVSLVTLTTIIYLFLK